MKNDDSTSLRQEGVPYSPSHTHSAPSFNAPTQARGKKWTCSLSLIYLLFSETLLPLFFVLVGAFILFGLPQSQEVLKGLLGPAAASLAKWNYHTEHQRFITPIFIFILVALIFSCMTWYCARLLVTVDVQLRRPAFLGDQQSSRNCLDRMATWIPRAIGTCACMLIVVAFLIAQRNHPDTVVKSIFLTSLACALPVCCMLFLRWQDRSPLTRFALWTATILMSIMLIITTIIDAQVPWTNWVLWACTIVPTMLLKVLCERRRWMFQLTKLPMTRADSAIPLRAVFGRLVSLAVLCLGFLIVLSSSVSAAREAGSASTILLFLTCLLGVLTASTLMIRHYFNGVPGATWLIAALITGLFLWKDESLGLENTPPVAATQQQKIPIPAASTGVTPDVVVNAYGGGLRAALFTAEVLATADDASCGEFGQHLEALSGVSGGSLGLSTYLTIRQEFIIAGGWKKCRTPGGGDRKLSSMVVDALLRDHLSPTLARMLTTDLVTTHATRGQALLDSWQAGLLDTLSKEPLMDNIPHLGFSRPLNELNGGLATPPQVYFNATNADTGKRVWFSNTGYWGEDGHDRPLPASMSVGQAVLHSSRFPLVSPTGLFKTASGTIRLVDGGYAENSGAATLKDRLTPKPGRRWINIDGNPPASQPECPVAAENVFSTWSPLMALLQVRQSQAKLAVDRLAATNLKPINAILNPLDTFGGVTKSPAERCSFVQGLRSVPLGWYITYESYQTMQSSAFKVGLNVCRQLNLQCDSLLPESTATEKTTRTQLPDNEVKTENTIQTQAAS